MVIKFAVGLCDECMKNASVSAVELCVCKIRGMCNDSTPARDWVGAYAIHIASGSNVGTAPPVVFGEISSIKSFDVQPSSLDEWPNVQCDQRSMQVGKDVAPD